MYIIILLALSITVIVYSKIEVEIKNLNIVYNKENQNIDYKIIVRIKIFGEITIFKVSLNKEKIEQILKTKNVKEKIKIKNMTQKKIIGTQILKQITEYKHIKIIFKDVKIFAKIGVEDILLTAYLTTFLSTIIAIFYELKVENQKEFKIEPIFTQENNIDILLNGKARVYIKNIIYIIIRNNI